MTPTGSFWACGGLALASVASYALTDDTMYLTAGCVAGFVMLIIYGLGDDT